MDDSEEAERILYAHRIKVFVEAKLAGGFGRGKLCCLSCGSDGEWSSEWPDWTFQCENCGMRANGRLSKSTSSHSLIQRAGTAFAGPQNRRLITTHGHNLPSERPHLDQSAKRGLRIRAFARG